MPERATAAMLDRVPLDVHRVAPQPPLPAAINPALEAHALAAQVESLRLGRRGDEHLARIRVRTARETVEVELVASPHEVTFSFVDGHDQDLDLHLAKLVSRGRR